MNKGNILITGSSSGLGLALCDVFIEQGYDVYCLSRSKTPRDVCWDQQAQFQDSTEIVSQLRKLEVKKFDYVFLNAGTLGKIKKSNDIDLEELEETFAINTTANKVILDFFIDNFFDVKNIISISSGAALKGYDGWLGYCLSKAVLKQLVSCYALEHKETFFLSLAPGVIKTKMQDYILQVNDKEFSSVGKFHQMYENLPEPDEIAEKIFDNLEFLLKLESGSYFDLRTI